MAGLFRGRAPIVVAFVLGLLIATAATAGAARLITGKEIKDGSITARDLSASVLARLGKAGPQGPAGPAGASGADGHDGKAGVQGVPGADGLDGLQGAAGLPGLSGYYSFGRTESPVPAGTTRQFNDYCMNEAKVLGGGFGTTSLDAHVLASRPGDGAPGGWLVVVHNDSPTTDITIDTWVHCASVSP